MARSRGKAFVSKSTLAQASPSTHKVWFIVAIAIVVLGFLAFLFLGDGGDLGTDSAVAGKGYSTGLVASEGFYWEQPPTITENSCGFSTKQIYTGGSSVVDSCCDTSSSCGFFSPPGADEGSFYCYSQNSVHSSEWLCSEYQDELAWVKCDSERQENILGEEFICDDGEWVRCSDDATSVSQINSLEQGDVLSGKWGQYLCNGGKLEPCSSGSYFVSENKKFMCEFGLWQTCLESSSGVSGAALCGDEAWKLCTLENVGEVTKNWQYYCRANGNEYVWSDEFELSPAEFSEVKLVKGNDPIKIGKSVTQGTWELCDLNTQSVGDQATLCAGSSTLVVDSVARLLSGNNKPLDTMANRIYLYENEEEPKTVSVLYTEYLSQGSEFSYLKDGFAQNIAAGRRVAFKLDNEYYVLSQPEGSAFNQDKLVMTHIPTLKTFEPVALPSNQFQFQVLADKAITFNTQGNTFVVSITKPGEAAAAYTVPHSLSAELEVVFTKNAPVYLDDLADVEVTVCQSDLSAVQSSLLVCVNGEPLSPALERDLLVETTLGGEQVALLFEVNNGVKEGHIFVLENVDGQAAYEPFLEGMTSEKRMAIEFEEELYLLAHKGSGFIDLTSLVLTKYGGVDGGVSEPYTAKGGEKKVDIQVPEGKITIEADFISQPPPPFYIAGQTNQELASVPVQLNEELEWSVSSESSAFIGSPELGFVQKSAVAGKEDVTKVGTSFKVESTVLGEVIELPFTTPIVVNDKKGNDVLLYYHSFITQGTGDALKTASLFWIYDLSVPSSHDLNDEFVEKFTQGNRIALQFDDGFYLLGYDGQSGLISLENLVLTNLEGEELERTLDASTQSAVFAVEEGDVKVTIDTSANKLVFGKFGAQELEKQAKQTQLEESTVLFNPPSDYRVELTNDNRVEVDGHLFEICDEGIYDTILGQVRLCEDGEFIGLFNQNEPVGTDALSSPFIINYDGYSSDAGKVVSFSYAVSVGTKYVFDSWPSLVANLSEEKSPVLVVGTGMYLLLGGTSLSELQLREYPVGGVGLISMDSLQEGFQNGTVSLGSQLVFFEQNLDPSNLEFTLLVTPLADQLIPASGLEIAQPGTAFTPSLNAGSYQLIYDPLGMVMVMKGGDVMFIGFLPLGTSQNVLLDSGDVVNIERTQNEDGLEVYVLTT